MSFSSEVKKEIVAVYGADRHCHVAELAALLNICGRIEVANDIYQVTFRADNAQVAEKIGHLIQTQFGGTCQKESTGIAKRGRPAASYYTVTDAAVSQQLLWATGLLHKQSGQLSRRIDPLVVNRPCCKRAFIRGTFLGGGSVSGPEKTYHLEFVMPEQAYARQFMEVLQSFDIDPKLVVRKGYDIVYFKKGEEISDVLKIIGANNAMMVFENQRVAKDMENTINRVSNCLSVNADKTVVAAVKQMEDISFIRAAKGLDSLPPQLQEIAEIRLNNPIISLKEIGQMLNPPIGKSGVNHRLRRISSIADGLR